MAFVNHSQLIDYNLGITLLQAIYSQAVIGENLTNINPDIINMVNNYYYNYSYYYSTLIHNQGIIQDIPIATEPTIKEAVYNFEQLINTDNTSSIYSDDNWINELEELLNNSFD